MCVRVCVYTFTSIFVRTNLKFTPWGCWYEDVLDSPHFARVVLELGLG